MMLPLNNSLLELYERKAISKDKLYHSSIKPILQSEMDVIMADEGTIWPFEIPEFDSTRSFWWRAWYNIKHRDMVPFEKGKWYVALNPEVNWGVGRDFQTDLTTYYNTRGIQLKANLGKKVSIFTRFRENQTRFPGYQFEQIQRDTIIAGQGHPRSTGGNALDYAFSEGYVSYSPVKEFNMVLGSGKNFIGDGYRSMLLSDHTFNYPYLKLTMNVWKVKYVVLYNQMLHNNYNRNRKYQVHPKKFSTMHYLSWDIGKRFQFGIYEAIIWDNGDSTMTRGFELAYLNPILFLRPAEFSLRSPDNATIGLNMNFRITDNILVYGQVMIDDLSISKTRELGTGFVGNKVAGQAGFKFYDLLGVEYLFLQTEYNVSRPYTYAHKFPSQNYSHYNHPLAHPLASNFHEFVGIVSYSYKRFHARSTTTYARYGADRVDEHNGQNIFISDFDIPGYPDVAGQRVAQGLKTDLINTDIRLQYVLNPAINLRFEVAYAYHMRKNEDLDYSTNWFSVGLSTNLDNFYFDF